jgi:hypothetical protein
MFYVLVHNVVSLFPQTMTTPIHHIPSSGDDVACVSDADVMRSFQRRRERSRSRSRSRSPKRSPGLGGQVSKHKRSNLSRSPPTRKQPLPPQFMGLATHDRSADTKSVDNKTKKRVKRHADTEVFNERNQMITHPRTLEKYSMMQYAEKLAKLHPPPKEEPWMGPQIKHIPSSPSPAITSSSSSSLSSSTIPSLPGQYSLLRNSNPIIRGGVIIRGAVGDSGDGGSDKKKVKHKLSKSGFTSKSSTSKSSASSPFTSSSSASSSSSSSSSSYASRSIMAAELEQMRSELLAVKTNGFIRDARLQLAEKRAKLAEREAKAVIDRQNEMSQHLQYAQKRIESAEYTARVSTAVRGV